MPGRPKVGQTLPKNRLVEYLGKIFSGGATSNDLSGVNISDTSNPSADDINKLYGDNPQDADISKDSNTLAIRPSVTPTHWWNQSKADRINNQLKLQDYANKMGIQNAIAQATGVGNAMIPVHAADITASGEAETGVQVNRRETLDPYDQKKLNEELVHSLGLTVSPLTLDMVKSQQTLPRMDRISAENTLGITTANAANADLKRKQQLEEAQFPLSLTGVPDELKTKREMEAAKLLDEQNKGKAAGTLVLPPGSGVYNAVEGKTLIEPQKILTPMEQFQKQILLDPNTTPDQDRFPANSVTGGVSNTVVNPIISNQGALPRLKTQPTDYSKDQFNVMDPSGSGKVGSIINGIFIPRRAQ